MDCPWLGSVHAAWTLVDMWTQHLTLFACLIDQLMHEDLVIRIVNETHKGIMIIRSTIYFGVYRYDRVHAKRYSVKAVEFCVNAPECTANLLAKS